MNREKLKIEERVTTTDAVYQRLRMAIVTGVLKPGSRLIERELVEMMGVSRTPIREALKSLENDQLVTTVPYRGVYVRKLTRSEAKAICQVRAPLEGLAARLATLEASRTMLDRIQAKLNEAETASRDQDQTRLAVINNEFHDLIAEASGNEVLPGLLRSLRSSINLLRVASWTRWPERPLETLAEHRAIVQAMCEGDHAAAEAAAIEHIISGWRYDDQGLATSGLDPE